MAGPWVLYFYVFSEASMKQTVMSPAWMAQDLQLPVFP